MKTSEVKKLLFSLLSTIGPPVSYHVMKLDENGNAKYPYITFFVVAESPSSFGDGDPTSTGWFIQVDYWSKGDMEAEIDKGKAVLKENGFLFRNRNDLYETDTKVFHALQEFMFYKEE